MARGNQVKELILRKMKTLFPDMFQSGKEYRIPAQENGERIEIKITLTCAKENIGGDNVPSLGGGFNFSDEPIDIPKKQQEEEDMVEEFDPQVTSEEKKEIQDLLTRLNL